jgi:beta-lactamase class C
MLQKKSSVPFACLKLWVLLVFILVITVSCEQTPGLFKKAAQKPVMDPYLEAFIGDYVQFFEAEMERTKLPGAALAIVWDGSVVFMKGYGVKSLGEMDSVDVHTVFRIGSLSKGFAGVLAAMLAKEGGFSLEDPVVRHVPGFMLRSADQARRVQVRHLLSHSAGLPYHAFTNLIEAGYDITDIIDRLKEVKLNGKEGEVFSYQNAAFAVVEEVVRSGTGQSYAELLEERIFRPAGMRDASSSYDAIMRTKNKAFPHEGFDSAWVKTAFTPKFYNAVAAGGVNASISDMSKWLVLLMGERPDVVSPAVLDSVFYPRIKTNNERRFFRNWLGEKEAFYGYGWRILHTPEDTIVYHGGFVNSFKGELALQRKDRVGVCVLMNGAGSMSSTLIPGFFERYRLYADSIRISR